MRRSNPVVLFGFLGLASFVAAGLLADVVFGDTTVSLPEPEASFAMPQGDAVLEDDPGAILAQVSVTAPEPLFEGATVLHPTVYDDRGFPVPAESPEGPGGGAGSAGRPGEAGSEGGATPPVAEPGPGGAAGESIATIVRFLDLCADNDATGCPLGIGATVLFGSDPPLPPPLRVEVIPEATTALFPTLRCGPLWPSQNVIPVLLLSNRPFDLLHVELRGPGGVLLDDELNLRTPPREFALYDQRFNGWQGTEATVAAGVHTCLEFEIDERVVTPPDRNGTFELSVAGFSGADHVVTTVKFTGGFESVRPPVTILPVDQNRAYLIVPQLADDVAFAWVYERDPLEPGGCEAPPLQVGSGATRVTPSAVPKTFPQTDMDAEDWPWDRSFSRYTVWLLSLKHSTNYTLCVELPQEGRTREWALQTPDGPRVKVIAGDLRYNIDAAKGSLRVNMLGVAGCWAATPVHKPHPGDSGVLFPDEYLKGSGTYVTFAFGADPMCDTTYGENRNALVGSELELRAGIMNDGDYGMLRVWTPALVALCTSSFAVEGPPCNRSLEWREPAVLCGDSPFSDCNRDVWYRLEIEFEAGIDTSTGRPDPRDWGISEVVRLGDQNETVPFP